MTDPILISAMPLPPSTVLSDCLCYQVEVLVVLKDISRVMSLSASFALGVGVGLRVLRRSCPYSCSLLWCLIIPLYAAHFLAFVQDIEDARPDHLWFLCEHLLTHFLVLIFSFDIVFFV